MAGGVAPAAGPGAAAVAGAVAGAAAGTAGSQVETSSIAVMEGPRITDTGAWS